jgi:hypothetical protein
MGKRIGLPGPQTVPTPPAPAAPAAGRPKPKPGKFKKIKGILN